MSETRCPACGATYVRRAPFDGSAERLASLFYYYPFRCQLCTTRFKVMQWGVRYPDEGEDKREYERIEIKFQVTFTYGQSQGKGTATDLSLTGCRLETDSQLDPGTNVHLQIRTSDRRPPLALWATVVRVIRPRLLGMKFTQVTQEQRSQLMSLVTSLLGLPQTKRP